MKLHLMKKTDTVYMKLLFVCFFCEFFTDSTMGFITIFHHHLVDLVGICLLFPATVANLRKCSISSGLRVESAGVPITIFVEQKSSTGRRPTCVRWSFFSEGGPSKRDVSICHASNFSHSSVSKVVFLLPTFDTLKVCVCAKLQACLES